MPTISEDFYFFSYMSSFGELARLHYGSRAAIVEEAKKYGISIGRKTMPRLMEEILKYESEDLGKNIQLEERPQTEKTRFEKTEDRLTFRITEATSESKDELYKDYNSERDITDELQGLIFYLDALLIQGSILSNKIQIKQLNLSRNLRHM